MFKKLVAVLVSCFLLVHSETPQYEDQCVKLVESFLDRRLSSLKQPPQKTAEYKEGDFVFFLHVPRTAGRTFWSCFLFRAFPPSKRCAKSYDILRLDLSRPDCQLLASHDDFSITDYLPDGYHVITQARDPVDRVISAYEFTALATAREFSPNMTKEPDKSEKVKTRDVWPWMYLIQLFDRYTEASVSRMFSRYKEYKQRFPKEADEKLDRWVQTVSHKSGRIYYFHRRTRESKWNLSEEEKRYLLPPLDPYNNSLILPLSQFVEFPMADELVHNAMTYQSLGLTNISYWSEASEIRNCAPYSRPAQEKLLDAAKLQMDKMLHISLTSRLDQSLRSIAATLKLGLRGVTWSGNPTVLDLSNQTKIDITIEEAQGKLEDLSDGEVLALSDKYREQLEKSRLYARSRRRSKLTKTDFLPVWDESIAMLEIFKEIQSEVMIRRKVKGFAFAEYPDPPEDENKKQKTPLWRSYKSCVNNTMRGSKGSKIKSMSHLSLPDERRAHFTSVSRKKIAQSTIDRIKEKNWMDVELYEYAIQLYEAYLDYQAKKGLLEEIPIFRPNATQEKPPDPPDPMVHDEL